MATASGASDMDYPFLLSSLPSLSCLPFIGQVTHVPLPPELLQEFDSILKICKAFFLTEIVSQFVILYLLGDFCV